MGLQKGVMAGLYENPWKIGYAKRDTKMKPDDLVNSPSNLLQNIIMGFRGIVANCSEHYPSMKDRCDIDEHEIKDVFAETCEKFIKADDYGELVD